MPSSNHVYSAFSFISLILVLIPFPWHFEAWNTGTCLYMAWTALANLNWFINSIIWDGNAYNNTPVWCDISTRLIIMISVAIPASSLCINRRLYHIATANTVTNTKRQKRQAVMVDLAIALGIPVLEAILQYIPQGHRYAVFEEVGCLPWTYSTPVAFALVYSWPLAISCVSMVYCILSIRAFIKRRVQFKQLLSQNNNLNSSRYFRLMGLAGTELLCGIPLSSWILYLNIMGGTRPWKGWADTHSHFSEIIQIPSLLWRTSTINVVAMELPRWIMVMCGFVFFAFFGFADEARKNYRNIFLSVAKRVGFSTGTLTGSTAGKSGLTTLSFTNGLPSIPIFIRKETSLTTDRSYGEKSLTNISVGSTFDDIKEKTFSPTETTSSRSSIHDIECIPPVPPQPAVVATRTPDIDVKSNTHDIV